MSLDFLLTTSTHSSGSSSDADPWVLLTVGRLSPPGPQSTRLSPQEARVSFILAGRTLPIACLGTVALTAGHALLELPWGPAQLPTESRGPENVSAWGPVTWKQRHLPARQWREIRPNAVKGLIFI